jgi:hypothetical protein
MLSQRAYFQVSVKLIGTVFIELPPALYSEKQTL